MSDHPNVSSKSNSEDIAIRDQISRRAREVRAIAEYIGSSVVGIGAGDAGIEVIQVASLELLLAARFARGKFEDHIT